ncbi:hypothetical protein SS50377_21625 [Spironucleus salmonicida]|uniref:Transmembrane protein n=1 Tax=Spironucleus salmonicida TaxID=348837 RepID=A0A9P8S0U1_9EUKA|nr:hypothetical protein SS50377_21625 [Spironucleus salmonicida]
MRGYQIYFIDSISVQQIIRFTSKKSAILKILNLNNIQRPNEINFFGYAAKVQQIQYRAISYLLALFQHSIQLKQCYLMIISYLLSVVNARTGEHSICVVNALIQENKATTESDICKYYFFGNSFQPVFPIADKVIYITLPSVAGNIFRKIFPIALVEQRPHQETANKVNISIIFVILFIILISSNYIIQYKDYFQFYYIIQYYSINSQFLNELLRFSCLSDNSLSCIDINNYYLLYEDNMKLAPLLLYKEPNHLNLFLIKNSTTIFMYDNYLPYFHSQLSYFKSLDIFINQFTILEVTQNIKQLILVTTKAYNLFILLLIQKVLSTPHLHFQDPE